MKNIVLSALLIGTILSSTAPVANATPYFSKYYHFNPYQKSPLRKLRLLKQDVEKNTSDIANNLARIEANEIEILANLDAIDALDTRISTLENTAPANTITVSIDCAIDSITDAINNAPASGSLTVEVTGSCIENIVVTRDHTTLEGIGGASIGYAGPVDTEYREFNSIISVIGADNVIIKNLNLHSSPGAAGLRVLNNASVLLKDSTLENNRYGAFVSNNAFLQMSGNTIQNNTQYGVLLIDGATAEFFENNAVSTTSSGHSALGLFRNATARLRSAGNTITNTSGADAVEVFHGSQFRSDLGTSVINGEMEAAYLSQIELRNTIVNGRIQVFPQGVLRIRPIDNVTINGNVEISGAGFAQFASASGVTTVNGDISCFGYNATLFGTTFVTATGTIDAFGTCNL